MYDINELLAKELFWTKENGWDTLMYASRIFGSAETLYEIDLPRISIDYVTELKELGVPYEIRDCWCIIHDPDVEEYHEITASFMTVSEGRPKEISTSPVKYTGKIPTNNMLEAANSYREKVLENLKQSVLLKRQKLFDEYFEKRSKDGLIYCWDSDIISPRDILSVSEIFSGKWGSKYYRIPLKDRLHDCIVISKATFTGKAKITLKVPYRYVGELIGHGGENAQKLARELGVGYVKIEAES